MGCDVFGLFKRLLVLLSALAICLAGSRFARDSVAALPHIAPTDPRTPEQEKKAFKLPPGFEAQLVAAEPDIFKPMNLAFDDRGRLWVTDTIEYPFPAPADRKPRDTVKILENFDENGRARKITTFADELNIPIGLLPLPSPPFEQGGKRRAEALVFSIPNIYRLVDTDGDGKADQREVLYGTFGANDTHGLTNAFTYWLDGWVYACHGFSNTSTVKAKDGSEIKMHSGNTYRIRPDGSRIEQFTWGQVNPFGLSFDELGNLFSADCHSRPVMLLLRGGYYPSFGKPHDGLGFAPDICGHDHGSTALAGIAYYAADHFPAEYRDTVFIGNVVTNRINHDRFERRGSTFKAVAREDFLVSEDPWFRPVDLKLGPDGALYVADFYNRIIGHYEVPLNHPDRDRERGRIWRIIYRGPDGKQKPIWPRSDWSKATVEELLGDLGHANLIVGTFATHQLVARGAKVVEPVRKLLSGDSKPAQRMHAQWVLERLDALDDKTLATTAKDRDAGVRVHIQRVLSERKEWSDAARDAVLAGLKDPDALVQRAAADALGTHPASANLPPLLQLRHAVPSDDSLLLHTVRMALRNQFRLEQTWKDWGERLLANERDARAVADVAPGMPSFESARFLLTHLQRHAEGSGNLARYARHIARHGTGELTPALVRLVQDKHPKELDVQVLAFKSIHQGLQEGNVPLGQAVREWGEELIGKLLGSKEDLRLVSGCELAGLIRLESAEKRLVALLQEKQAEEPPRRAAAAALTAINSTKHVPPLGQVLADAAEPIGLREHAAGLLGSIDQPQARTHLLKALTAAPGKLETAIAFALAGNPTGAEELLKAVEAGKASARLLQEPRVQGRLRAAKRADLSERLTRLTRDLPPADKQLQALIAKRLSGFAGAKTDTALGAKIFEKHCSACHQISGKGAKIGPQLDGIGLRGPDRLLEDLLDPSRNVDEAFRTTTILYDGRLVSGLFLNEEGELLLLADHQGKEVRIPKTKVEKRSLSPLSPMPANLAEEVAEADFYHLLAYLLAQRLPEKLPP